MPILLTPTASPFSGTLRYVWVDRNGVERDLTYATSPEVFVARGSIGLGAPPVQIADEKLPWAAGSVVRQQSVQPAKMTIPVMVHQSTMADLVAAVDTLRDWFDTGNEQRRTPGYFRVIREDDTVRQRLCYYAGGLEGNLQDGGPTHVLYGIELSAPDPWPTDEADQIQIYDITDFPFTGSAYQGAIAVFNDGQLDAYPVWTITGPAQGISLFNTTTGKAWGWGGIVPAGQTLTVDTRPASQRFTYPVTLGSGASSYSFITADSELWWLVPGVNGMLISIGAMVTADTRVQLQYRQRFRGGLR